MDEAAYTLLAAAGLIAGSLLATALLLALLAGARAAISATAEWFRSGKWRKDLWP